jgi:hypothetical protein
MFDLGRWGAPNEASILRSVTRVRVTEVTRFAPVADPAAPLLALWAGEQGDPAAVLSLTQTDFSSWFRVTPGYTPTERFHVGWKLPLPAFVVRGGVLGRLADNRVYLAAQADTEVPGATVWALGPKLADPGNGVRPGDIVAIATTANTICAPDQGGTSPETTIAEVLPPDPLLFPGGAVVLESRPDACWEAAVPQGSSAVAEVAFTVRSSGLVTYGERLGYLGRPVRDEPFVLQWVDEANPLLSPEDRAIARKLRRFYYPGAEKCDATTTCPELGEVDPLTPGPALAFRVGFLGSDVRTGPEPVRGEQLVIDTQSGVSPMSRKPVGSGALPLGIASVDRSTFVRQGEVVRFYVAYQDDQVFVFSPGQSLAEARSIR